MQEIKKALQLYWLDNNGTYPPATSWRSECANWGEKNPENVIPGLVPNYLPTMPSDPYMNVPGTNKCCYIYRSYNNNKDYKFLDHNCTDINYQANSTFIDPRRDGGSDFCKIDGTGIWSWAIYTTGATCI